jgi:hypothetical protein
MTQIMTQPTTHVENLVQIIVSKLKSKDIEYGISHKVIEMIAFDQVRHNESQEIDKLVENTKISILKCLYDDTII